MFSNDRFMTMATGLVLAIAVGAIAQNSGALLAYFTGDDLSPGQSDQFTVRSGGSQTLDVLANDNQSGEITIVDYPACGVVRSTGENTLEFLDSQDCAGDLAFTYCVAADGVCEPYEVILTVINTSPSQPAAPTQVASAPAPAPTPVAETPAAQQPEPEAVPLPVAPTPAEPTAVATVQEPTPTPTNAPTVVVQGDRLNAGQILLEDDSSEVTVSGFGAASGPSLFAPDLAELIQPQETVAVLRHSVEAIAPSRIAQDENIATQSSAATPSRVETASASLGDGLLEGTEASPTVSFTSPSQPRLGAAPMLAPAPSQPGRIEIAERGPEVFTAAPVQTVSLAAIDADIVAPINAENDTSILAAATIAAPSANDATASADTSSAQVGSIMIESGVGVSDVSDTVLAANLSLDAAGPTFGASPTLTQSSDTLTVAAGPAVTTAAPNGINFDENLIDKLVASISADDSYVAPDTGENDLVTAQNTPDEIDSVATQTASAGQVSISAADPADSSDIVVEMAAQILLPSPQLNESLTRVIQTTPATESILSDKLFTADLQASTPPSEDEVEVASIAPVPATTTATELANDKCDVRMSASARPGAGIAVFVSSLCRVGQTLTISHADFAFSAYLDEKGTFSATIPAFTGTAVIDVDFDDGASAQSQVLLRDADDLERLAIVWSVPVNLDLHAFEGDATENSKGHVWVDNARTYRDTLTGGGGFLETFGDPEIAGGFMAEVYSLPTNRIRRETTVSMDLRITGIESYCDNNMILRTVRSQDEGKPTKREFNLKLPECGAATGGLVLENFVDTINVARR